MKLFVALFLFTTAVCSAGDDALRTLLGVQSLAFEMPPMKRDGLCEVDFVTYVDGVREKSLAVMRTPAVGGGQKTEVLWARTPGDSKVLFSRGGQADVLKIDSFPEDSCMSFTLGKPPYEEKDGWLIVGYWVLNQSKTGRYNSVHRYFEQSLKANKRVFAIAVREVKDEDKTDGVK
jgi:hypothetical protein